MKIGLIDVDGHHFPNLALMKISTYHKRQGDTFIFLIAVNQIYKSCICELNLRSEKKMDTCC